MDIFFYVYLLTTIAIKVLINYFTPKKHQQFSPTLFCVIKTTGMSVNTVTVTHTLFFFWRTKKTYLCFTARFKQCTRSCPILAALILRGHH